jgi:glutamate-ammonia-ligase adenylyltransferase
VSTRAPWPDADATEAAATLRSRIVKAPIVANEARAQARFAALAAEEHADLSADAAVRRLLLGIADHSPFLWHLIRSAPARLSRLLDQSPQASLAVCLDGLVKACAAASSEAEVMRLLRLAKQETALLIALADLGGIWSTQSVMAALTQAADVFVRSALRFVLKTAASTLRPDSGDFAAPEADCGLVILALGKHGAGELNYSSDTDLIVLFDPASSRVEMQAAPGSFFVRLTRQFVKILQERTGDGYVLRVDLRLRPDPGATAIAISLPAAYAYYEVYGQNWERAALIKARPIAGDLGLGAAFIERLRPFIWRKYLDYAAIADIHAMKRQIHALRGHAEIAVEGHNLKLGRGGIREIEFFVQTQQLVYGGKKRELRGAQTLVMLQELAREGLISLQACEDLTAAYLFLREIEHRLQMVLDEQTQRLPMEQAQLQDFAQFCGYADRDAFAAVLAFHLNHVGQHYARLFERAPELSTGAGNLVFTGISDDPETLETLSRLGFRQPALTAATVRGWHFGRHVAMRSERARALLTELVPALLLAFAQSGDPDAAVAAFDSVLGRMKAVGELLAILKSNARLRGLFATILGSAPRLAEMVVRRPHVLDAAIDEHRLAADCDFNARLAAQLSADASTEEFLDVLRDFAQEESFLIGLRLLADLITPDAAGHAYTGLAESIVGAALAHVREVFATKYGVVAGSRCVVLGLGKLGSREMTAASDLDLIVIYDFNPEHPLADGPQGLHAVRYFTALTQRFISYLTVTTRRGRLYDVDMRLRPSGRKGPVATQFASFTLYQSRDAQSWEHLALTRARVIAGDPSLVAAVEAARVEILARPRFLSLRRDIAEMRALIAQEKPPRDSLDLKYAPGGLIDIDFLAQYFSLAHAHEDRRMLSPNPVALLAAAEEAGFIVPETAAALLAARRLYTDTTQLLQTLTDANVVAGRLNSAVRQRLAAAAGLPDFPRLEAELSESRSFVQAIFRQMIG